jgi:alpha-tubulin suppressor-like RCC1 family protein
VPVLGSFVFSTLAAGNSHTCGLLLFNCTAYCWGYNNGGRLGDGSQTNQLTPAPVLGGYFFSTLALGWSHTCGLLLSNATAYCWGNNQYGQLGDGSLTPKLSPTAVIGGYTFMLPSTLLGTPRSTTSPQRTLL